MQTRTAIQIKKTIIENGSKVSSAKEKAKEQAKASRREEKVKGEGGGRVVTTAGRATARRALGLGSIDC